MKILFMGTPEFAVAGLNKLIESPHEVCGVVTVPDKPAGRGKRITESAVKKAAQAAGLPVLQPVKLKNPDFLKAVAELQPDLAVVIAFRMLPQKVWSIPRMGTLNLHASLLPDYRGAAPINWVLINGEKKTGLTTFFIDKKIDTGAILLQQEVQIPDHWTAGDLHDEMMERGAELVLETVNQLEAGTLKAIPQDHTAFEHPAPKIFREDCEINWDAPRTSVVNYIRGLSPWPGAWTYLNGKILKIFRAESVSLDGIQLKAGELERFENQLIVGVADGCLSLQEIQLEGKARTDAKSFLQGYRQELKRLGND